MNTIAKIFYFLVCGLLNLSAQSNFVLSDPFCLDLMKGNFQADTFAARAIPADSKLVAHLAGEINADSLRRYLVKLVSFNNRNTVADNPNKPDEGIRGARNWVKSYLSDLAQKPGTTLFPCEFDFDYTMCSRLRHRELLAVIPGNGPLRDEMVIVEAHLDSRCEDVCDTLCLAQGADDNTSGSSLLMEIARVMSKVQLNRTLVLIWITGEEQGLGGSQAFAAYCKQNNIKIKAVFNNDIVGGIECGVTSSPPGCPGPNLYDSLRLRIFSAGTTNSMPKNLARMTRILVEDNLARVYPEAPKIDVMFGEDRSGRGSDHIPFRQQGYTSIRFTSSYENGDGNPSQPNYVDRQHSSRDILGKDLNGDGILDSLYVNFTYLKHNAIVNALSASNAATSDITPFALQITAKTLAIDVKIENPQNAVKYYFGVRRINNVFFDTLIVSDKPEVTIEGLLPTQYYVTACGADADGWINMFGLEYNVRILSATNELQKAEAIELLQNRPNPFDEQTLIPIVVNDISKIRQAELQIHAEDGRLMKAITLHLKQGINEIMYDYSWHNYESGVFYYSLILNHQKIATRTMLMGNW